MRLWRTTKVLLVLVPKPLYVWDGNFVYCGAIKGMEMCNWGGDVEGGDGCVYVCVEIA